MRLLRKYHISSMPFPELFAFPERRLPLLMRVDEKLWEQGWYFTISAAVFGNVINSSASSKCGVRNVFRFKEKLNKNKLLARAFSLYYMQGGCRKVKMLWVKDT